MTSVNSKLEQAISTLEKEPIIRIDLDDVCVAGSVRLAILAEAEKTENWIVDNDHPTGDQDAKSLARQDLYWGGAEVSCPLIDPDDGRVAVGSFDGEGDEDDREIKIKWSQESLIEILCPVWFAEKDEILANVDIVAEMAQAASTHKRFSDTESWRELIQQLHNVRDAICQSEDELAEAYRWLAD